MWTHAELEEHLEEAGRQLLRQLMQDHLDLRARREEEAVRSGGHRRVAGLDGRLRPWRETAHARWLACLFGLARVERMAHRGPSMANVHPADAALSLPAGRHSMGLRRLAVTEAVRGSFDDPLDITGARWGLHGAEAVLELRTLIDNGDLDSYWRFHAAREHQRLSPASGQQDYDLTA